MKLDFIYKNYKNYNTNLISKKWKVNKKAE